MALTASLVVHHAAKTFDIQYLDMLSFHLEDVFVLEACEQAADGLQRKTQITADLLTGHAEKEVGGRKTAAERFVTLL